MASPTQVQSEAGVHSYAHATDGDRVDTPGATPAHAQDVLASPGQPLDAPTRAYFERVFGGENFGAVRVHADAAAASSARALRAAAYTAGHHIVFGPSRYDARSLSGRRLIAHELAHTVQQRGAAVSARSGDRTCSDRFEAEADRAASDVLAGTRVRRPLSNLGRAQLQLKSDSEFEARTRVDEGLADGTMTQAGGVHGETFTANDCFNLPGCGVSFLFEKAYEGTHPMQESLFPADWRGVYVKIVASPVGNCGICEALELLQILRYLKADTGGDVVTAEPTGSGRRALAGSDDPRARSQGWMVDSSTDEPFYSRGGHGIPGTPAEPAVLWDAPASYPSDRNAGKEFETYLVCVNGDSRIPLGSVNWGYFIDDQKKIAFRPLPPKAWCGAGAKLFDAAARWDALHPLEPGEDGAALKDARIGLDMGKPPQPK